MRVAHSQPFSVDQVVLLVRSLGGGGGLAMEGGTSSSCWFPFQSQVFYVIVQLTNFEPIYCIFLFIVGLVFRYWAVFFLLAFL